MKRFGWMWGFLLGLGLVGGLAAPGSGESPTGESLVQLREISVEPRDAGLAVQIKTSGPAAPEAETKPVEVAKAEAPKAPEPSPLAKAETPKTPEPSPAAKVEPQAAESA